MASDTVLLDIYDQNHQPPSIRQQNRHRSRFGDGNEMGERLPEFPRERMKTVLAALLLFASSLCNSCALAFVNEVFPRDHPLPDVIFRLIPMQEWAWPASDMLVLSMASMCVFSMLLHRYRWIVMRRIFLIASVLYCFRAMAMVATWMPLADKSMNSKCVPPQWFRERDQGEDMGLISSSSFPKYVPSSPIPWSLIGQRMWHYGISLGFVGVESNRVLCGDYIYSGHTLMYVLTTLTIRTYMPRSGFYGLLRIVYPLATILGMLFVVVSRLHYTIDVLVAYWVTTLTYCCFHALIALPRSTNANSQETNRSGLTRVINMESDDEEQRADSNHGSRGGRPNETDFSLFGTRWVVEYFEKNVPPGIVLPREMHWPYSGPTWICRLVNSLNDTSLLSCDD